MKHPTKSRHYCTSADGTLYRVVAIHEQWAEAEVEPVDGGADLVLPLAELRRVADPRNKRPPIQGMPGARPTCQWCGKLIRPVVNDITSDGSILKRAIIRREFVRWGGYHGLFCTMGCALTFALAAHRRGYRRQK